MRVKFFDVETTTFNPIKEVDLVIIPRSGEHVVLDIGRQRQYFIVKTVQHFIGIETLPFCNIILEKTQ